MKEALIGISDNFKSFLGGGPDGWFLWGCFCAALLVCFFKGKDTRQKIGTVSVLGLLVIFNPLFYQVVGTRFLSGVYWRLFWILPVTIACGVMFTELISIIRKYWVRLLALAVLCLVIGKAGTRVINGETYTAAENRYQIPQEAVEVSELILEANEGFESMAVVPDELTCYIRQYTSKIRLAYGRNLWGFISSPTAEQVALYELVTSGNPDPKDLHKELTAQGCNYIVFNTEKQELPSNLEANGFSLCGETGQYRLYRVGES